jgi:predicted enzyme related to lactoylglutathione lyase
MARVLVNIDVDDLERAVRFYSGAFGLRVGRRFGASAVEILGAEAPIYLLLKGGDTLPFEGAGAGRDYRRHWSPVHLDFVVDDLEQAVARAEAAGARRERGISEHQWGRMALLSDPFGHGFCLLQFTGAGYDEIAAG